MKHKAQMTPEFRVTIEPLENGDDVSYRIVIKGHGKHQQCFAADMTEVRTCLSKAIDEYETYATERVENYLASETEVHKTIAL